MRTYNGIEHPELSFSMENYLQIETERAEAVVATNHGAHGVLHPAVVEVAFAPGKGLYELPHGGPGRWAHAIWTFTVNRNPLLTFQHVTGVLDGVFVFLHEVVINGLPDGSDAD